MRLTPSSPTCFLYSPSLITALTLRLMLATIELTSIDIRSTASCKGQYHPHRLCREVLCLHRARRTPAKPSMTPRKIRCGHKRMRTLEKFITDGLYSIHLHCGIILLMGLKPNKQSLPAPASVVLKAMNSITIERNSTCRAALLGLHSCQQYSGQLSGSDQPNDEMRPTL